MSIFTTNECIPISAQLEKSLQSSYPRERQDVPDPRIAQLASQGVRINCQKVFNQRGVLIINDGDEVETNVWRRFSLCAPKPLEVISLDDALQAVLNSVEASTMLQTADVIIAPRQAAPRALRRLQELAPDLISQSTRIVEVSPNRTWSCGNAPQVNLSSEDRQLLSSLTENAQSVVIFDDVVSTCQTACEIAEEVDADADVSLLTLVSAVFKEDAAKRLSTGRISQVYSGIVTGYKGGDDWRRPAINTTAGLFDETEKGAYRRQNIEGYLADNGRAFRMLCERLDNRERIMYLLDLDGTVLEKGQLRPALQIVLQKAREESYVIAATGRSQRLYNDLSAGTRDLFEMAMLEGGMSSVYQGQYKRFFQRRIQTEQMEKLVRRAALKSGGQALVTYKSDKERLPWWVRIRAKDGDIDSSSWTEADSQAAADFAAAFTDPAFAIEASGYGDVLITLPGTDKATSGIDLLAQRFPMLPPLSKAIAAGDGPNDISLLRRTRDEGGISFAINPSSEAVSSAATETVNPAHFAERLRSYIS